MHAEQEILTFLGMLKTPLCKANIKFQDHFTIDTFATLLLQSGLRIAQGPSESAFLEIFFFKDKFSIKFTIKAV